MAERKSLDGSAVAIMVVLCLIWSLQQIAMKAAFPAMPPGYQVAVRSCMAALLLLPIIYWRREGPIFRKELMWPGMAVATLFGLEFLFIAEGLRLTSASHVIMFLYTAPLFAALGMHAVLPDERLAVGQWIGLTIAFGGVVISFWGVPGRMDDDTSFIGDMLAITAGACWGGTTLVVRATRLSDAPASITLLYQLGGAGILLTAVSLSGPLEPVLMSAGLVLNIAFQTLIVSLASFLVWFMLLRKYLASRLGTLSFMTPIFGVGLGVLLLGERLEPAFVCGSVAVLVGVFLVSAIDPRRV